MKILVTGSNGQLGRAIGRVYEKEKAELILTDVVESHGIRSLNITNIQQVMELVEQEKPDLIINCAAHTNVDQCEKQLDLAYQINAIGPRNLSIAAAKTDAVLVHISTDYVFSGDSDCPYTEFHQTAPVSAYGRTKLAGEHFVEKFAKKYYIIRTAWLYGEGHNFVKTMLRLSENHEKVSVVCDQIGSPTSALELARMIHYLAEKENYGIFHGTCQGSCSWADFAAEIFRLAGKSTVVEYITTEEYEKRNPLSAKRPAYSVLDNYMMKLTESYSMAHWKDAIKEYLKGVLAQEQAK